MTTIASQITSLTVVYSIVYSEADQRTHQCSASLAFVWGIHRDRWIPRTKGQLRGKCFHLMTSSSSIWSSYCSTHCITHLKIGCRSGTRSANRMQRLNKTREYQISFTEILPRCFFSENQWKLSSLQWTFSFLKTPRKAQLYTRNGLFENILKIFQFRFRHISSTIAYMPVVKS